MGKPSRQAVTIKMQRAAIEPCKLPELARPAAPPTLTIAHPAPPRHPGSIFFHPALQLTDLSPPAAEAL